MQQDCLLMKPESHDATVKTKFITHNNLGIHYTVFD